MTTGVQNLIIKLASRRFTDYPLTSLFLSLRPAGTRRPGLVFLKKELARVQKSIAPRSPEAEFFSEEAIRLQAVVEEARVRKANQLAAFISARTGFFETYFWSLAPESDLRISNSFVRGFRPHLYPLSLLADRLESFLLLVADLRKGELFKVEAGKITESWQKGVVLSLETRREKRGAFDRRTGNIHTTFTKRVEGHLKTHQEKYFKELARQAVAWAKSDGIRAVIVGADAVSGPPIREEIARIVPHLPAVLAPIDTKLPEAKKLGLGILAFRRREQEMSLQRVEELFSPGRRKAVFGATETLEHLRTARRAEVLIVDEGFHQERLLCGVCSAPAATGVSCSLCGGPLWTAAVENELVCLAAAANVEIEFVKNSEPLARKGGAGLLV